MANGRPRRTDYYPIEFSEYLRQVSDKHTRVYFTDIDFVEYYFDEHNEKNLALIIEAKRKYQIRDGVYRLVDSDKTVIIIAKKLGVPFMFVFYDEKEAQINDDDEFIVVHLV